MNHSCAARDVSSNMACIPSNYSRLIARVLALQIRDLPKLLASTQLSVKQFMQEDTLLTSQQQIQILNNSLKLSKDEAFGLRLGSQLNPSTHGSMGFLVNSSPDLLTALKAFQTYMPTRMSFTRLELMTDSQWLECYYYIDLDVSADVRRCLAEASAMILFEFAEFIVGRPLNEAITSFSYSEPHYSQRYSDFIPGQFEFSAPHIMVKIPLSLCQVSNASANRESYLLALKQCERMLAQLLLNKHTNKYQVQKMMLSNPSGILSEEDAAAAMFISKRTLARRLQQEGTAFRKIRDAILSQQAVAYLSDSHISVEAIAALLNYHDSANFRRAFKRWFQLSPDQYRQHLRAK
ncbi:MAG: AraC-like DNA-binding protein [Paraglaciecola sp.]|jgi:AraC-like DNA-binding protein